MRFDPISLRLLVAIAQTGSITGAGARMHLAPAAASRRIVQLEADVGVPLLDRLPRGASLNAAGTALLRHAQEIEDAYQRMQANMGTYASGLQGTVRVAANSSAVLQFLPQDLRAFRSRHHGIQIDLAERTSESVVRAVREGTAELGVYQSRGLETPVGLEVVGYRNDRLVLIVPKGRVLSSRKKVWLADALDEEFVAFPPGTSLRSLLVVAAQEVRQPLQVSIQVMAFDAMIRMVAADLGVAVVPVGAMDTRARSTFSVVALRDDWACRQHSILHRPGALLTRPAALLADFLAKAPRADRNGGQH